MIASSLGARVIKSPDPEFGYFPVYRIPFSEKYNDLINTIPSEFPAFHWHSEMFEIPDDAKLFATTEGCPNQAFMYKDRVLALQFHPETTPETAQLLLENCSDDLNREGRFVSTKEEIEKLNPGRNKKVNGLMLVLLDIFLGRIMMGE